MKHARKMALVDVNTSKAEDTNPIVKAINSLTSASEFSRDYYGTNASAVTYLDSELKQILERTDLNPSAKLTLYSQTLNRYLLLRRMSEKQPLATTSSKPTPIPIPVEKSPSLESTSEIHSEEEDPNSSTGDSDSSYHTITTTQSPKVSTPVTPKIVQQQSKRSKLPRTSPKTSYLRNSSERQPPSRYADYFSGWTGRNPR